MRRKWGRLVFISLLLIFWTAWSGQSQAQVKYPTKPINLIIPFGVGGAVDIISRVVAANLSEKFGVPVAVINKPGGNTIPATLEVMNAAPDGYTILADTVNCSLLAVQKDLPFKILDRTFIATATASPLIPVVSPASPWRGLKDLGESVKKNPESFTWVSAGGLSNITGYVARQIFAAWGVDVKKTRETFVKSGAEQFALVAGGHANMTVLGPASAGTAIKAGTLRALAITSKERWAPLPDLPTTRELGYPTVDGQLWVGFSGPLKLPPEIVEIWNETLQKTLRDPKTLAQLDKIGMIPHYRNPEETRKAVIKDIAEVQRFAGMAK